MALTQLAPPYPIFTDKNGDPLDNGYLYFGEVNKNPETNPIQVYYDSAFTQPAAQPLRTSNGYVMRNGSPALIYADSQFSVTVRDKNNALVIYSPVGFGVDPASISGTVVYDDFIGDGATVNFTLSASPSTKNATSVYIDGVYQSKDNYSVSGSSLTFSTAPPLNSEIEVVTQESSIIGGADAQQVTYVYSGAGAVGRTVQSRLRDFVTVKDYGAKGDGSTDDYSAFIVACSDTNQIVVPEGDYHIGTARLGEFQKPLNVMGTGPDSIIRVMSDNVDNTAFRVGAVGGAYYRTRAVTKFESLVFMTESGIIAPWAYTGIDVQSTFPIVMKDIVCLSMGPASIKCSYNFYGYVDGYSLVNSGLTLFETNVVEFSGGDIRSEQASVDPTRGTLLFSDVGRYPVEMEDSDLVKFTGTVFEGWKCPVFSIIRSDDTVFNGCWFEGLESISHIMKVQQSDTIEFNSCQLDFRFPYTDSFIHIDNSGPDADRRQRMTTFIRVNGGNLATYSVPFGPRDEWITTANDESVTVLIDGVQFAGGMLFASRSVDFDVKSIFISRGYNSGFYSKPNAMLNNDWNQWMPNSVSSDWDFSGGAGITQLSGSGLTITTTTAAGEFMTGTTGVKVAGITSGGTPFEFGRSAISALGPVTVDGQSYFVFSRVKADQDIDLNLEINGGYLDFGFNKTIRLRAGEWRDIVLKTDEATTWAQGRFFNPTVKFTAVNNSGTTANFFIDRLDYQIVDGDIEL